MSERNKRRKQAPEYEEGAPAWMNTYGDMVTLLLTFFVLLFSFSVIDAQKWAELASAFAGTPLVMVQSLDAGGEDEIAIHGFEARHETDQGEQEADPNENVFDPGDEPGEIEDDFLHLYQDMKHYIEEKGLDTVLSLHRDGAVILLRVRDSALFDSGRANIKAEALPLLNQTIDVFDRYAQAISMVRIEGHTDNVPMSSPRFTDNWDLSMGRATNILRYFLDQSGLKPQQYSAVGYGEFQPISCNESEEGRASNRRVDFVILGEYKPG